MRWQLSQYDGDWASYTSDLHKQAPTFDEFRRHLIDALTSRDKTVLTIRSSKHGHAVVAYDVHEQADGSLEILTYNPQHALQQRRGDQQHGPLERHVAPPRSP